MRTNKRVFLALILILNVACTKEKVPTEFSGCSDTVSFSEVIAPLIQANCSDCHKPPSPAGNVLLTNHIEIADEANRMLIAMQASGDELMPSGGPALNDSLIQYFQCWILQGKLDN